MRGLSGGELRRLCLAEMLLGNFRVMIFDKISTGLDSAVTHDIIKYLTLLCKSFQSVLICCLLQPEPSTILLFDNLMLIEDGYIIYNGKCDRCEEYFNNLGYFRPSNKDLGSFLIDLCTEDGRKKYKNYSESVSTNTSNSSSSSSYSQQQSIIPPSQQQSINYSTTTTTTTSTITTTISNNSNTTTSDTSSNNNNHLFVPPSAEEMKDIFLQSNFNVYKYIITYY